MSDEAQHSTSSKQQAERLAKAISEYQAWQARMIDLRQRQKYARCVRRRQRSEAA